MPASGGDPVTAALRLSLTANQGSGDETSLDKRLAASTARVLLTHIEYERATNCMVNALNKLKNKYIVLRSQDTERNGADTPAPSSNSNVTVNCGSAQNSTMKPEPDSLLPTPKVTLFPPENVQLGWRGSHCVGAGMINVGNTCYLNSTLQALFHVPAFVNWLHSDNHHLSNCTVSNGAMSGECIICAMNKTLKASQCKSGTIIKPFLIYNKLKFICKHLVHGQQEDAHEFMRYLLESMEKAYLSRHKGNKLDSYSKETTPLNQIFGGYIRTEVTCLQCGGVSTTFQHCQDLLLDIRRASTLDDALAAYFCKERLDGDDAYRCERCHRKVSATKKFSIEKPPQVLCIQFKRFSILGGKINKHVSFTQRLDLTRFLCPQSTHRGPVPLTYRLVSVVTHVGSSVHCGHYTAVAQTSTGHYYQFDDSSVRPISLAAVLDTNAYIMMYEREPVLKNPSNVPTATVTTTMCALNGQKSNLTVRSQPLQGPTTIPANHKIGTLFNHKPNSMTVVNHKSCSDSTSIPTSYSGPSTLPPAKERDRVVFGLHQPAASPATPRLVMHIKNGKVYRPPPQPSPQQQEPSASTAASLVPYCESGEDESSSSDSEPPPRLWDMPSLDDVSPTSPLSQPLSVNGTASVKTNSKRNLGISVSMETVSPVTQVSAASCSSVGKSVHSKRTDLNSTSTNSDFTNVSFSPEKICSDIKSKKSNDFSSPNSVICFSLEKHKNDYPKIDTDANNVIRKIDSLLSDKSVFESSKQRKTDFGCPSRSRNCSVSLNKDSAENMDSWRADNSVQENGRNKIISPVRSTASKIRQGLDMATSKEVVSSSSNGSVNLHVNVSLPTSRNKYNSGWQVTDQLLHSPSLASESSTSSTSIANSTTDWAVSDIKQKKKNKKLFAAKTGCLDSDINPYKSSDVEMKVKDEPPWKSQDNNIAAKPSCVEKLQHFSNGDSLSTKYETKSIHAKKRKYSDDASNNKEDKMHSSSAQCTKNKEQRETDREDNEYSRKLKKIKKHKKREKSSEDNSDASESAKDAEDGFEWVEKTHETLGLNSSYPAETNGHSSWDGTRKADVTNHLTQLSHRGYGTANVTSWSGERSRMDEEIDRDRKEDRKRNYNSSYDEDFDRGRVKKVKHHHSDHHSNNSKYNPFQDYHNYKHQWGNSNGNSYYNKPYYRNSNKAYYHYNNNHHSRHKQFIGRSNGYHNGNKYHDRYTKRDRWRH